jgi:sterol desaturase/sphingolipid hydroxylase (fatty acid hydroxylase superfamily)
MKSVLFPTSKARGLRRRQIRPTSVIVGSILVAMTVLTIVGLAMAGSHISTAFAADSFQTGTSWHAVGGAVWHGLKVSTLAPYYWLFIGLLTGLQFIWPARREEARIGADMAVDAVWFVVGNAMQFSIVAATLGVVTVAYTEVFGTWSMDVQQYTGRWGLIIVAYVVTDFLAYVTHVCHHRVPTLWRFHAVHHSQQRLNALADHRTHVGEVIAAALIVFIPSEILGLNTAVATTLAFIGLYYSAMLHANIRTNLGPLRFVLMGPQPHRVHHSVLPKYFDHNYGTTLPWWDMIFGTYYWDVKVYPPTGITDTDFPLREPGNLNPLKWVAVLGRQLAYPYKAIYSLWCGNTVSATSALTGNESDRVEPANAQLGAQYRKDRRRTEVPTPRGRRTAQVLLPVALAIVVAAGCGGSSSSPSSTAKASSTETVKTPLPAGRYPSAVSKEVCISDAPHDVALALGEKAAISKPTWADHLYTCRYSYPNATMTLSVKELSSWPQTLAYFNGLGTQLGIKQQLKNLGQGAFQTTDGSRGLAERPQPNSSAALMDRVAACYYSW